jgi:hypothetical protein
VKRNSSFIGDSFDSDKSLDIFEKNFDKNQNLEDTRTIGDKSE